MTALLRGTLHFRFRNSLCALTAALLRVDASRWAISVRGFNGIYSNKLLVLVDGRTVYSPDFSGVYWNQLAVPLDTIERIEVVRGPGGTVWGANAVNGVINIITKKSGDTQGASVSAGAGSFQTGDYEARYDGKLGHLATYRVFGGYSSTGNLQTTTGVNAYDGWNKKQMGFRTNGQISSKDAFTVDGSELKTDGGTAVAYGIGIASTSRIIDVPLTNREFNVLGRWTHTHAERSESSVQISESNYSRRNFFSTENINTIDFDFQNHFHLNSRNDIVWGAGYRFSSDDIKPPALGFTKTIQTFGLYTEVLPLAKEYRLFSAFFQDEVSINNNLTLTIGSKVEHNAFSGVEYEPSTRLAWTSRLCPGQVAPRHQTGMQSYFDLSSKITLDASAYYVNRLTTGVPAYTRVDARLGYQVRKNMGWSIVGQNLLQARHQEFVNAEHGVQSLMERSVFSKVVWSF